MRLGILEERPRFVGGSERMSLGLCRHAVARGHSVLLACADDGDMVEAYRAAGAAVRRASIRPLASRRPFALGRSVGSLAALVRRERLDVLFTSQVSYVSLLAAVSLMTGVRSAVHLGVAYEFPSPLFWTAARFVGMGIAPSEHTAEAWRRRGWRSGALQVVPNGVDTSVFCPGPRPAARARLRLSEDVPTVAYVGRLVREKGILTLLRAFARYRQKAQTGRLLLVGEAPGDQIAELHRVADEQGLKKDAWQVREPTSAPEDVYRAADLVVVPSEWDEPFGLVALEAGACGVVTVVSDRGVLPSLVEPLGDSAVFPAGDSGALAARLACWLGASPAGRDAAGARLGGFVAEHYPFRRCGDAYLGVFEQLIAS